MENFLSNEWNHDPHLLSIERGNLKNEIISILCNETILLQNSSLIKTPRDNLRWYTGYKRREILTDERAFLHRAQLHDSLILYTDYNVVDRYQWEGQNFLSKFQIDSTFD